MLGDELFGESVDAVDLRSILEIDRGDFLWLYVDLFEGETPDEEEMDQAKAIIGRFIDRVESLLGSYRMNSSCLGRLLSIEVGRILWSRYTDVILEDIHDCIAGYVRDLYEGKEDERLVLSKIEKSVQDNLSALYRALNDEEYLLELALVHSC